MKKVKGLKKIVLGSAAVCCGLALVSCADLQNGLSSSHNDVNDGNVVPPVEKVGVECTTSLGDCEFDIESLYVTNDDSNLIVKVTFNEWKHENLWKNYSLNILIDNLSCDKGNAHVNGIKWKTNSGYAGIGSWSDVKNGSVETEISSAIVESDEDGINQKYLNAINYYSSDDDSVYNDVAFTGTDFAVENDTCEWHSGSSKLKTQTVTYRIPFEMIGGLKKGDSVRVYAATTNAKWIENDYVEAVSGIIDQIPSSVCSSVEKSDWIAENPESTNWYELDMSKALEYKVQE